MDLRAQCNDVTFTVSNERRLVMLAYAATANPAARTGAPRALILILAGHAVLIGAVMSAKMGVIPVDSYVPTEIFNVPIKPPLPPEPQPAPKPDPQPSFIGHPVTVIDVPQETKTLPIDRGPPIVPWNPPVIGDGPPLPPADPVKLAPVRAAAVFATPSGSIKPPYPNSKLRLEEEATLRLRLSIDARGRVVSVEPVGATDPEFLAAARRHILRSWRYKPATEDGVGIASTTVITLTFRLEDA
jgi:protein TonB